MDSITKRGAYVKGLSLKDMPAPGMIVEVGILLIARALCVFKEFRTPKI